MEQGDCMLLRESNEHRRLDREIQQRISAKKGQGKLHTRGDSVQQEAKAEAAMEVQGRQEVTFPRMRRGLTKPDHTVHDGKKTVPIPDQVDNGKQMVQGGYGKEVL